MKAQVCPVCGGTGQVPAGFYDPPDYHTTYTWPETCRSCNGLGYVLVPEADEYGMFGMLRFGS